MLHDEILKIYTIIGSLYHSQKAIDRKVQLTMPEGLYIVRAGTVTRKLFIP
jgi:hypothetical protein